MNGHVVIGVGGELGQGAWFISASLGAKFGPLSMSADGFIASWGSFSFNLSGERRSDVCRHRNRGHAVGARVVLLASGQRRLLQDLSRRCEREPGARGRELTQAQKTLLATYAPTWRPLRAGRRGPLVPGDPERVGESQDHRHHARRRSGRPRGCRQARRHRQGARQVHGRDDLRRHHEARHHRDVRAADSADQRAPAAAAPCLPVGRHADAQRGRSRRQPRGVATWIRTTRSTRSRRAETSSPCRRSAGRRHTPASPTSSATSATATTS